MEDALHALWGLAMGFKLRLAGTSVTFRNTVVKITVKLKFMGLFRRDQLLHPLVKLQRLDCFPGAFLPSPVHLSFLLCSWGEEMVL